MKRTKIIYWTTTGIFSALMLFSGILYFISSDIAQTFNHLGFPDYFRVELGIAKITGAVLLLLPLPKRVNEWVYMGFTIVLISAPIAHAASGDPVSAIIPPLLFLGVLGASYAAYYKLSNNSLALEKIS